MSVTLQHTVWCDKCGDWDAITGSASNALREVKKHGWRRFKDPDGTIDLCRSCVARRVAKSTAQEEER